ncbi:MAG: Lrp/AsnC family transcriptional regulator [Saprospiraceae bacterium]|nr:Lrp/AsnC family transcriptional regulator [Saprospiraceae bacterium]
MENTQQKPDHYDLEILKMLENDGRIAFSNIAIELGISNTMVHQRVSKLTESGILKGVRPILDEKKLGFDWASFTGLTLDKDHKSEQIIEALKDIKEVSECYYVTGAFTLFIRISAKNHEHMRKILYEKIDNIPGISKTDSFMELGCAFKRNIIL